MPRSPICILTNLLTSYHDPHVDETCRPFTNELGRMWGPSFGASSLAEMLFCARAGVRAAMARSPVVSQASDDDYDGEVCLVWRSNAVAPFASEMEKGATRAAETPWGRGILGQSFHESVEGQLLARAVPIYRDAARHS